MDATPDQFIFQADQRQEWKGDLARDSLQTPQAQTPQARLLWSVNETKTVNVHPLVSLCNFLYSSGTRVIQDRIGTSSNLCDVYGLRCFGDNCYPETAHSHVMEEVEGSAFWFPYRTTSDRSSQDVTCELSDGWTYDPW